MEKNIKSLLNIQKLLNKTALICLVVLLWGELFLAFSNYKSLGELVYSEYGEQGIGFFYAFALGFIIFLFYTASKIGYDIKDLEKKQSDEEFN